MCNCDSQRGSRLPKGGGANPAAVAVVSAVQPGLAAPDALAAPAAPAVPDMVAAALAAAPVPAPFLAPLLLLQHFRITYYAADAAALGAVVDAAHPRFLAAAAAADDDDGGQCCAVRQYV
eukprot:364944-Chlamydomonas_euryale.AAC.7